MGRERAKKNDPPAGPENVAGLSQVTPAASITPTDKIGDQQTASIQNVDPVRTDGGVADQSTSPIQGIATAPTQRTLSPRIFSAGDVVADRYRVLRFIAQGGMGEVYEVEDLEFREHLALKTVRPEVAEQEGMIERFKREIYLSRKVTHPNVCRIFDLGRHRVEKPGGVVDDVYFLTMELLEGETLGARLKRVGKLSPRDALPIVRQVASALATAHEAGIVHRDLKSSNVLLVPGRSGERAVVTDFGLARGLTAGLDFEVSLTVSGNVLGTPAYMAPEQVEGGVIGPAVDIYALGVVMYEMVTGMRPFTGDTPLSVAVRRLKEKPQNPNTIVKDLPAEWEYTILRCLERQPADRFQSAAEIAQCLIGGQTSVARRTRRRLMFLGIGAVLVAMLAGTQIPRFARRAGLAQPATPAGINDVAAKPRRSLAVLGLRNLGQPQAAWMSTAMSEMLRTELAAGEKIRTIPGENVARMRMELAFGDSDSLAPDTLARVKANLGADLVVVGSYLLAKGGRLRLDLRLQDTSNGEVRASASEVGTEEEIFDLVSNAGGRLRANLGLGEVPAADVGAVRAALPSASEALRQYSAGLAKLRLLEAQPALGLLQRAAAAEPSHPLIHSALASALSALGYDEKARQEAQKAFDLSQTLPREERVAVEGLLRETSGEWDKAVGLYRGLVVFFPDNIEYGLRLAAAQSAAGKGQEALTTIAGLRKLPPPVSEDPRLDLAEATAAKSLTDFQRQSQAAARAASRAEVRGARLLLAQARLLEGSALVNLGQLEAARKAGEQARRAFSEAGDLAGTARSENILGVALASAGDLNGAKARFQAALAAAERIGDRRGVADQHANLAGVLAQSGDRAGAMKADEMSLRIYREIGNRSGTARQLNNVASHQFETGRYEEARRTYEETLRAFEEIGEKRNAGIALANLGETLQKLGRLGEAAHRFEASIQVSREAGAVLDEAATLTLLGRLRKDRDDLPGAKQALQEALARYRQVDPNDQPKEQMAEVLDLLADLAKRSGDEAAANKLREEAAAVKRGR